MVVLKCKMCGGDIEVSTDKTNGKCDSCGSVTTLPQVDNEQRANLFNRANRFRQIGEYDKAILAYESLLNQQDNDAEAYWCVVLSRFGIEYVEDPKSGERIPTCHRMQVKSILADPDYLVALEQTQDNYTRELYQKEAGRIAEIQKEIMAITENEKPYDIFICYKESDGVGNRTKDSIMAQEIYYQLINEGYKVFFARITLEEKLGKAYEPYIFAALHSAKIMLVIGSKQEYFNAVWVKNEWARYLDLLDTDKNKLVIPCYRDLDAYDIPDELSVFQSQDMGKIGFAQDLLRGIKKILDKNKEIIKPETVNILKETSANASALLTRGLLALEDKEWSSADEYFERVLDLEAECAEAYLGKFCVEINCSKFEKISLYRKNVEKNRNFQKAIRFANGEFTFLLNGYIEETNLNVARDMFISMLKKRRGFFELKRKQLIELEKQKEHIQKLEAEKKVYREKNIKKKEKQLRAYNKLVEYRQLLKDFYQEQQKKKEEHQRKAEVEFAQIQRLRKEIMNLHNDINSLGIILLGEKKRKKIKMLEDIQRKEREIGELENSVKKNQEELDLERRNISNELEPQPNFDREDYISFSQFHDYISYYQLMQGPPYKNYHGVVGVKYDGTAVIGCHEEDKVDVSEWENIETVHEMEKGFVGIKTDGDVVCDYIPDTSYDNKKSCLEYWSGISKIEQGFTGLVGLKLDGTVITTAEKLKLQMFTKTAIVVDDEEKIGVTFGDSIIDISSSSSIIVGLRRDGTVVTADNVPETLKFQKNRIEKLKNEVDKWNDIVGIEVSCELIVGVKSDGTVVSAGHGMGRLVEDVKEWCDIVSICVGALNVVGVKSNGTVVSADTSKRRYCGIEEWKDIIAVRISKCQHYIVGLKADGTVVVSNDGEEDYPLYNVSTLKDIMIETT